MATKTYSCHSQWASSSPPPLEKKNKKEETSPLATTSFLAPHVSPSCSSATRLPSNRATLAFSHSRTLSRLSFTRSSFAYLQPCGYCSFPLSHTHNFLVTSLPTVLSHTSFLASSLLAWLLLSHMHTSSHDTHLFSSESAHTHTSRNRMKRSKSKRA
jgi:hypothetical protein